MKRQAPGRREPTLLYTMKALEQTVRAQLDEIFRPIGLTARQYTVLTVLQRHPETTSAHLARWFFVTNQSMADMVGALLKRELIERHQHLADRRRLVLALTPAGVDLLADYRSPVAEVEARMLTGLSPAEVDALLGMVDLCRNNLQQRPNR